MINNKIAFYIKLSCIGQTLQKDIDLEKGNPGIGGTPYLFLITVKYLNYIMQFDYALILTDKKLEFNDNDIPIEVATDVNEAIEICKNKGIDTIVLNANIIESINKDISDYDINIILWAHNSLNWKTQCISAKRNNIKKIVCVSKKQYENLLKSPCSEKIIYINNSITSSFYNEAKLTDYTEEKAVYIGSIMPQKGCHNLLDIWRSVEKKCPNAKLYIFGSAHTWNRDIELGKMNIADKYYERILIEKLKKIKNKNNIIFCGNKSWQEIGNTIKTARVAIVNPSHYLRDETFCMSALELETHGIPIVSRQRNDGLNTSILNNKTGFLEKKDKLISEKISLLLTNSKMAQNYGCEARKYASNFLMEEEVLKWIDVINNIDNNTSEVKQKKNMFVKKSKEAILVEHDKMLKIIYTIMTGKIFTIIKRKIYSKRKE